MLACWPKQCGNCLGGNNTNLTKIKRQLMEMVAVAVGKVLGAAVVAVVMVVAVAVAVAVVVVVV